MEKRNPSRVAQLGGLFIGLLGIYLAFISGINLYSALTRKLPLIFLALPMLAIAIIMILLAHRAFYRQTGRTYDSICGIAAFLVVVYADDLIEPLVKGSDVFASPDVTVTALTGCLATAVYYGLRKVMYLEAARRERRDRMLPGVNRPDGDGGLS